MLLSELYLRDIASDSYSTDQGSSPSLYLNNDLESISLESNKDVEVGFRLISYDVEGSPRYRDRSESTPRPTFSSDLGQHCPSRQ